MKLRSMVRDTRSGRKRMDPVGAIGMKKKKKKKMNVRTFKASLTTRPRPDVYGELEVTRGCDAQIIRNVTNVDPNLMDNVVDEPSHGDGLKDSPERLPKTKDGLESESLTQLGRSRDNAMKSESGEKCVHPKAKPAIVNTYLRGQCLRTRKRVQCEDGSPSKSEIEKDDAGKKHKRAVTENVDQVELEEEHRVTQVAGSKEGDISDEQKSLPSSMQREMMRLCQILKISEDATRTVRRFLEYAIKNHQVNTESPEIVQAFQISVCWIGASISKQKMDMEGILMITKQQLNYQCTEEQVHSVYSEMKNLKMIYLQCSENTIFTSKDSLSAKENINKEPSKFNKEGSQFSPFNLQNVKPKIEVQKKPATKDKGSRSAIDMLQRKCDKRMKKIIREQNEEIKEFGRIWEEKRSKLAKDHKLDNDFGKKIQEHNLLRDVDLKNLEAQHVAATNEERKRVARWLAQAKINLRAACGARLLLSQSEDKAGCSQSSSTHTLDAKDAVSISRQLVEDQNHPSVFAQGNEVGSNAPIETSSNLVGIINPENEVIEQLNKSDHLGKEKIVCENLPASGEIRSVELMEVVPTEADVSVQANDVGPDDISVSAREEVSDEIGAAELEKEVLEIVANKTVDLVHSLELSNASSDREDAIGLIDTFMDQRDATDDATNVTGQILEPSVACQDNCVISPQQVEQDTTVQSLVPVEQQDQDAPEVENQSTSWSEIAAQKIMDTVTTLLPNIEMQESQSTSQIEIASKSVCVQANDVGPDEIRSVELEREVLETVLTVEFNNEIQGSESTSLIVVIATSENVDTVTAVGPIIELEDRDSPVIGNEVTMSQTVTFELPNQDPLRVGIDPTRPFPSWNSPSLFPEPLQNVLENICKETELLDKSREDMVSRLKSDLEKEIAQARAQCEAKIQEAGAEFRLRKNELDKNQNKLLLRMHEGIPSSFRRYMHQRSQQHSARFRAGTSFSEPAPHQEVPRQPTPPQVVRHIADLFSCAQPRPPIMSHSGSERGFVGGNIRFSAAASFMPPGTFPSTSQSYEPQRPQPPSIFQNGPLLSDG